MTKRLLIKLLIFQFILISCSGPRHHKVKHEKTKVKIFVSWPGAEARPHYYWPIESDKPKGIEPELIELILNTAKLEYEYVSDFNFSGAGDPRVEAITSGNADIAIRGMSITADRKKKVNFSNPYYKDGLSALVRDSSQIYELKDLNNKRIYAHSYTTAFEWCKANLTNSILYTHDLEDPTIRYIEPEQLLAMDSIDAYIIDYSFLKYQEKSRSGLRVLNQKFNSEPIAIAVHKENKLLLDKINKAIKEIKKSGQLETILNDFEN